MSVLLKIPLPYKGVFDGGAISGDCTIPSSEQAGQSFHIRWCHSLQKICQQYTVCLVCSSPGLPTIQFMIACSKMELAASNQKLNGRKVWEQGHIYIYSTKCFLSHGRCTLNVTLNNVRLFLLWYWYYIGSGKSILSYALRTDMWSDKVGPSSCPGFRNLQTLEDWEHRYKPT